MTKKQYADEELGLTYLQAIELGFDDDTVEYTKEELDKLYDTLDKEMSSLIY